MTELSFPEIDAPRAELTAPSKPSTLEQTALASFEPIEAHLRTLAARYKDVAYDVTTPKGMADAKAARHDLRENGRYATQRLQERLKKEANALKRTLDDKAEACIKIVQPAEDAIHSQIAAEETRKATELARIRALDECLAGLSGWIERCKVPGITAERIANGIKALNAADLDPAVWQEYLSRALVRRAEVVDVMRQIHSDTLAAEMSAAKLEAQRVENERVAAELAERQRLLDEQAAAIARQKRQIEDARLAALAEQRQQFAAAESVRIAAQAKDYTEGQGSQRVLKAEPATADATDRDAPVNASPVGGPMGAGQPAAAGPAAEYPASSEAESAEALPSGDEGTAAHADTSAAAPAVTFVGPEPDEEDEGGIDLLREALDMCEHAALPFASRFPSHPKPSPEWWAALRNGLDHLRPRLLLALARKRGQTAQGKA